MLTSSLGYIILIAILAFGIAYFQYFFKAKRNDKKTFLFAFLRFTSIFLLGFLLINPKFKQTELVYTKPKLFVAVDNSESIRFLDQGSNVNNLVKQIKNSNLSSQFDMKWLQFGSEINLNDTLDFRAKQTNLSKLFKELKSIQTSEIPSPTIIVTDGNQTYGQDYILNSSTYKQPIYPIVVGDTALKTDLNIKHIQHNKYAYLKNEFPVEITLNYLGKKAVNQKFSIFKNNSKVYSKPIEFSSTNSTQVVNFTLRASNIGKSTYTARIAPLDTETNTKNNTRNFSITVIDERTKVAIVSNITHPDLGALKKSIETNKQRKVDFLRPNDLTNLNDYQLVILYQPDIKFKSAFEKATQLGKNYWIITGLQTDWAFLNSIQNQISFKSSNQQQDYLASFNESFDLFQTDNISFESFPPLKSAYGNLEVNSNNKTVLYQRIGSHLTNSPLFSFVEYENSRIAILLGEGIWKWRAQSFINQQGFEDFDAFVGKTIQFLASKTKKERLVVSAESSYNLGEVILEAQYFDKNYVLDTSKKLYATIVNEKDGKEYHFDLLFKGNAYILNLNNLSPGTYRYTIGILSEGLVKKGDFEIVDYNIEEQFLNPDVTKLNQLATNKENRLYLTSDINLLISDLQNNEQFKTTQKITHNQSPLIEWQYLLGVLLFVLGLEWFLRKYNGLI